MQPLGLGGASLMLHRCAGPEVERLQVILQIKRPPLSPTPAEALSCSTELIASGRIPFSKSLSLFNKEKTNFPT